VQIDQVVYLTVSPFSKRDNDRFGVDIFLNHGIDVIVLDLTSYFDKYVAQNYVRTCDQKYDFVIQYSSFHEVKKFITTSSENTIFIAFIGNSGVKSLRILNVLSKHNKQFGTILSGLLPSNSRQNLFHKLKRLSIKNLLRLTCKTIYRMFNPDIKLSFVVASGDESDKIIKDRYKNPKIIYGHTFDYDLYLQSESINTNSTHIDNYILFLDDFFPFHPDFIRIKVDYSHLADSYYKKLSKFFDAVEEKFSMKVVIGAHPRSYYDELPDYWQGRKFVFGDTINLVKNAKICLLHASTSINFAVLYEKPIVFVTMEEIRNSNVQSTLVAMAKELDKLPYDIDHLERGIDIDINMKIENYEKYISKYIKSSNSKSQINNWEILYRYFTNNND